MSYYDLQNLIKSGIAVIVCGKVIDKIENLPTEEQVEKCKNKIDLHEKDTFFGLPANTDLKNNSTIYWNYDRQEWNFKNIGSATKESEGLVKLATEINATDDSTAATPKLIKEFMDELLNTVTCASAASEVAAKSAENADLVDRACNLLNNQKAELDNFAEVIRNLQGQINDKDKAIALLNVEINKYKDQGMCDADTIEILSNSIKRLGSTNMKLEECLEIIAASTSVI